MNIILNNLNESYACNINSNPHFMQQLKSSVDFKPPHQSVDLKHTPLQSVDFKPSSQYTPSLKIQSKRKNTNNLVTIILQLYNDKTFEDTDELFNKFVSDFTLNIATELDEKNLYENFKFNSRGGMTKTYIQSMLQLDHTKFKSNKLSILFCLSDYIKSNIRINNGSEYINTSKYIESRETINIYYDLKNKSYTILKEHSTDNNQDNKYDYIDKMNSKHKSDINEKLQQKFGVINDIKNVKNIYISHPDLKSITSYKLSELIEKATTLKIDISNVNKKKKDIYDKLYSSLNN
tara:strand:- start:2458 stop:3333 length:876 start_codon:yes stop_codon:yes gene_type:complete